MQGLHRRPPASRMEDGMPGFVQIMEFDRSPYRRGGGAFEEDAGRTRPCPACHQGDRH